MYFSSGIEVRGTADNVNDIVLKALVLPAEGSPAVRAARLILHRLRLAFLPFICSNVDWRCSTSSSFTCVKVPVPECSRDVRVRVCASRWLPNAVGSRLRCTA